MSNRAYIPHGDYSLDPDQASLVLHRLTHEWDALDLAPMLGLADDEESRWVYDPIYRVQRARPRPRATHTGSRTGQ